MKNGKMVELSDKEKAELFPKVEPVVEPTIEGKYEELEACVMELAELVGGMQ